MRHEDKADMLLPKGKSFYNELKYKILPLLLEEAGNHWKLQRLADQKDIFGRNSHWIIGGDGYTNSADVWSSEDGVEWECHTADAPWAGRVLPYVTSFDGALWLMGGQALQQFAHQGADNAFYRGGEVTTDEFYGDVWRSVDGEHWECILAQAPWGQPGRGLIGSPGAVKDGYLWLFSGGTYDTPDAKERKFCNDVWRTANGRDWECVLDAAPWGARQYAEIAAFDDRLWVVCGCKQTAYYSRGALFTCGSAQC